MTITATRTKDREATATRLIKSSVEHSYDPLVDIDWDMPQPADLPYIKWEQSSLYGTPLWDSMTVSQRIELTRHEIASVMGVGNWFEGILIQMLIRDIYDQDPQTRHAQYGLIEIADECRHMVMFARTQEAVGAPSYKPSWFVHNAARGFKAWSTKDIAYAGTIVAEELTDMLQRDLVKSDEVQPLIKKVCQVHITEEARHVRYAREEVARIWPKVTGAKRWFARLHLAIVGYFISASLVRPEVYANVGLDPKEASRVARSNPHWRQTRLDATRKVMAYLDEQGAVSKKGITGRIWRAGAFI